MMDASSRPAMAAHSAARRMEVPVADTAPAKAKPAYSSSNVKIPSILNLGVSVFHVPFFFLNSTTSIVLQRMKFFLCSKAVASL